MTSYYHRNKGRRWTTENWSKLQTLVEENAAIGTIADRMGRSIESVRKAVRLLKTKGNKNADA